MYHSNIVIVSVLCSSVDLRWQPVIIDQFNTLVKSADRPALHHTKTHNVGRAKTIQSRLERCGLLPNAITRKWKCQKITRLDG